MKTYDALYIFVGVAKDDALEANLEKALAEVTLLGGNVIAKDSLGRRTFARPMKKHENGVYVKVRLELDADKVDELIKRYKLVEEVFRGNGEQCGFGADFNLDGGIHGDIDIFRGRHERARLDIHGNHLQIQLIQPLQKRYANAGASDEDFFAQTRNDVRLVGRSFDVSQQHEQDNQSEQPQKHIAQ